MESELALRRRPSSQSTLGNQVHVWQASLAIPDGAWRELWALLSRDERAQADRYRNERDRQRFAAAHGVLRVLLARYLAVPPAALRFAAGPHGKPDLIGLNETGSRALRFNLAHSGERALFVFAQGREVGVDLEAIDPRTAHPEIVERFFAPGEQRSILAHRPAERPQVFARLWTLKEAYLKALGLGLTQPLDSFEIALEDSGPRLVAGVGGEHATKSWTLRELSVGAGYAAAVCVAGTGWELCTRDWEAGGSV